jgi:hypothetical protein
MKFSNNVLMAWFKIVIVIQKALHKLTITVIMRHKQKIALIGRR